MFKKLNDWRQRRFEQKWTNEVYEGLKNFIGEQEARKIFSCKTLEEKIAFLEQIRDEMEKRERGED